MFSHKSITMPKFDDRLETISPSDRSVWRAWLEKKHFSSPGVWPVYYKVKSGRPSVRYSEAVREALCSGPIDSKVRSLPRE